MQTQVLPGVAIIGRNTWAVFSARNKLKVEWDASTASKDSWTQYVTNAKALSAKVQGELSTLVAAEMMGRTCYGIEISPAYCDVIVTRWQQMRDAIFVANNLARLYEPVRCTPYQRGPCQIIGWHTKKQLPRQARAACRPCLRQVRVMGQCDELAVDFHLRRNEIDRCPPDAAALF